jgi:hypothetical protein
LKAVADKLEELLADWDGGIQGKTSGTARILQIGAAR